MPIQFNADTPELILLALLLVGSYLYFWWVYRRSLTDMSPGRKRLSLGIRLFIVTLLFLGIAQIRWVKKNDSLAVVFLLDASRSIREDQRAAALAFMREAVKTKRPKDSVGIITFGQDPHIKSLPAAEPDLGGIQHTGAPNASNIAQALDASLSTIPPGSGGKIVVLSDGNENVGNALAHAPTLAARGVKVDSVPLPSTLKKEALIDKLALPGRVKIGEPFAVKVITNALNPQSGKLTVRRDGIPVGTRDVEMGPGRRVHEFQVQIDKAGFYRFEASLETDSQLDTRVENNKGLGFVAVRGKPNILYVAPDAHLVSFLKNALKSQNIEVNYVPPAAMPTTAAALQQFDSVILSDVNRDAFSAAQLAAMQVSTRDFGTGFAMIGGENSFGLGGYRKTPIEEVLPVSLDIRKMQRFPPVTVAMVIDRSGSMEASGPGGRKLDLAKSGAARAVEYLKPTDKVAVVAFDSAGHLVVPTTPVSQKEQIVNGISGIGTGGGTSVYSGVETAWNAIKGDENPIKHMIVLTDGVSNDPDYTALLTEMKKQKVTVTGVLVGAGTGDTNQSVLAYLASQTGGRYYSVDAPSDLPRIYLQEIERISSRPIMEEPFKANAHDAADQQMPGVDWGAMPLLLGYNVTEMKPTADLLLSSHRKEPVLATWRYGLGRSMAFTSDDKNKWAVHWLPWSGYGQFWAQAVRWTMRSLNPSDFQTQVTMDGTRGHIVVDALDKDGKFVNRLKFQAKIAGPNLSDSSDRHDSSDIPLRQTGPGHYEGWFDAGTIGTYLVNVIHERPDKRVESTVSGLVVPYSPEYRDLQANEYLLTQLAQVGGGSTLTSAAQVFGANRPSVFAPIELYRYLLFLAMLLFPFDVAIRRLALERADFARAWEWLTRRRTREGDFAATPELARLKSAKQRTLATAGAPAIRTESTRPTTDDRRPTTVAPSRKVAQPTTNAVPTPPTPTAKPSTPAPPESQRPSDPTTQQPDPQLTGMGRLMAAKQRAKEQQKPKDVV